MGFPVLMNMVEIVLTQLDKAATPKDKDFREQRQSKVFAPPVTLLGQANFGGKSIMDRHRTATGDTEVSAARFVFRTADLEAAGITIKKGDRITSVAGFPVRLEVNQARPESPLRGKFLLLYVIVEEITEERASV